MRITYAIGKRSRMPATADRIAGAIAFSSSGVKDEVNRIFTAVA
jgi:hypothetical protein